MNEYLRRIRGSSPACKVRDNVRAAARAAGGMPKLGRYLIERMNDRRLSESVRAAMAIMKILVGTGRRADTAAELLADS